MKIDVNGTARQMPPASTVADLLVDLGRRPDERGTAIARNGEVVTRADWATTVLDDGDRVEVLTARQGG